MHGTPIIRIPTEKEALFSRFDASRRADPTSSAAMAERG